MKNQIPNTPSRRKEETTPENDGAQKKAEVDYRGLLTELEQKSQESFDKTVLTLSAGALGLSVAFIKDIVGTENAVQTDCLLAAWTAWSLSSTFVLSSFFTSQLALRKAIHQLDDGKFSVAPEEMEHQGGWYDRFTFGSTFLAS